MNTNIIGIGGNSSPPNPRLGAYLIKPYEDAKKSINKILLTSSLDQVIKNEYTSEGKQVVQFNTNQKIIFAQKFAQTFYPEMTITANFVENTNSIDGKVWLQLWNLLETEMTIEEKDNIYTILSKISPNKHIDIGKVYSIRHPFWFRDILFGDKADTGKLSTYGGPAETYFNFIRAKASQVSEDQLTGIFGTNILKQHVKRIIVPSESRVTPYGEATISSGKSGKRKIRSIELHPGKEGGITKHYNGEKQIKNSLNTDIEAIHGIVGKEEYHDFWSDFSKGYQDDRKNI